MRIVILTLLLSSTLLSSTHAKKSSSRGGQSSGGSHSRLTSSRPGKTSNRKRQPPASSRRRYDDDIDEYDDIEEEEEEPLPSFGFPEPDSDIYDASEEDEPLPPPPRRKQKSTKRRDPPPRPTSRSRGSTTSNRRREPSRKRSRYDDDSDYEPRSSRRSSSSSSRKSSRRGAVVPYSTQAQSAFTRGLTALKSSIPDPSTIAQSAQSAVQNVQRTTSKLSATVYREVKGLTSSELEQVMLKATRPDDGPVKGKHVERLVGVTYQISGKYDIYDSVLRKLWNKMVESDWRTTIKALYILHRFSADGAPDHQAALKARLRELRRTRDPKRKDKYFNSKQLLAGDSTPENMKYRAFMARYAHYVLLRAQCFGGTFAEISQDNSSPSSSRSSKKKSPPKPLTSTALRTEHLEAATMLLKAGCACSLKPGEECENTAYVIERVASDMIALTTAVAVALNRAFKQPELCDEKLLGKWCAFYGEELRPQVKTMVKATSKKLDAYGLFLPSRMGASVSQELLQKGLDYLKDDDKEDKVEEEAKDEEQEEEVKESVSIQDDTEMKNDKSGTTTDSTMDEEEEDEQTMDGDDKDEEEDDDDEEEQFDVEDSPKRREPASTPVGEDDFEEYYEEDYYDEEA